jgi:hypothetical protein
VPSTPRYFGLASPPKKKETRFFNANKGQWFSALNKQPRIRIPKPSTENDHEEQHRLVMAESSADISIYNDEMSGMHNVRILVHVFAFISLGSFALWAMVSAHCYLNILCEIGENNILAHIQRFINIMPVPSGII